MFIVFVYISVNVQVQQDNEIKVGTLIALMVGEGEDWKSVETPSGASGGTAAPPPAPAASAAPAFTGGSGMLL